MTTALPTPPSISRPTTFAAEAEAFCNSLLTYQIELDALQATLSPIGRNMLVNGNMVVDQRNAGASITPTTSTYCLDRWLALANISSKFSVQQNAGAGIKPTGFANYLGVVSLSAYAIGAGEYCAITQRIEGLNTAFLQWGTATASSITVSFWVYSSLTGTFGGTVRNNGGTRSYPFTYSIPVANTWTKITKTIPGDTSGTWATDTNNGIEVNFGLGVGTTLSGTANVWAGTSYASATGAVSVVGTNAATWRVTGVQVEAGGTATAFENKDYATMLLRCQRYYQYRIWQAGEICAQLGCTSANNAIGKIFDYGPMRTTPTLTIAGGFVAFTTSGVSNTALSGITCSATQYGSVKVDTAVAGAGGFWSNVGDVAFLAGGGSSAVIKLDAEI